MFQRRVLEINNSVAVITKGDCKCVCTLIDSNTPRSVREVNEANIYEIHTHTCARTTHFITLIEIKWKQQYFYNGIELNVLHLSNQKKMK